MTDPHDPGTTSVAVLDSPKSSSRRLLFKTAGASAAGIFAPQLATGQTALTTAARPPSPPTTPWAQELPVQRPIEPESNLSPAGTGIAGEKECGRADHQAWSRFAPQLFYKVDVKIGSHSFHPELPTAEVWGYEGKVPGPLFHARYGQPILVRFRNQLPNSVQGFGSPDISVHLHNLHTPSESDGFPIDWFSAGTCGATLTRPGEYKDHHYPMVYAGVDAFGGIGDPREALGTLWYHDHRVDFTAANVYRGMAGFFLAFDEIDSGNENDPNPNALRLPSGEFDVPLMLSDKYFDSGGHLSFDQFNQDGFIGDKWLVNGKIQPYFHVAPRKYRFRLLAAATARVWDLQLRFQNRAQSFAQIANDGNLFEAPLLRSNVMLGNAERADIVVDFSRFPVGSELFLTNRLKHLDGRKPENDFLATPDQVLKFIVDRPLPGPDNSRVLSHLRDQPPITMSEVVNTRNFVFARSGGGWTINDRQFANRPLASPKKGTAEIWNLVNPSGGWAHPVHIHFEEGRILKRNGGDPPAHERGRKDVYLIGPNERVQVFLRFRDFVGKYVIHCHNTIHEDHAMMGRWDIVA
ncbi:bilirubin oxidase [Ramlibacter henchirensis]|uniref:Multicopper oxidase CueO n=1 Tax=Ramlibacter henchirensis TaxID=204072 RepID=A0A4Z0C1V6_9BURK|nr:multicopper oxidase domain-containing protein [Ramlibacter henchirensis]TFZ05493.1 bilirubin oxidase [Ramlibacter henchirensis]